MAAEIAHQLVDTTLGQCSASRWVIITVLAVGVVGAVCLAFPFVRPYSPGNRLDLFKLALEGVEKVYRDSTEVLQVQGDGQAADRIREEVQR
jgi:hypothetical protein